MCGKKGIKGSSQYLHLAFPTEKPPFLQPKCNFPDNIIVNSSRSVNSIKILHQSFFSRIPSFSFVCLNCFREKEGGDPFPIFPFFFPLLPMLLLFPPYLQMRLERKIGWGKILLLLPKWACVCVRAHVYINQLNSINGACRILIPHQLVFISSVSSLAFVKKQKKWVYSFS